MAIDLKSVLGNSAEVEEEKDVLGGGRSFILESGAYDMLIDMAYLKVSDGGSYMLMVNFKDLESGIMVRARLVMTSGTAKGTKSYYVDKNGKQRKLPGKAQADELSQICAGKDIGDLVPEEKTISLWSFADGKEVPTKMPVYMDLIGKRVKVGVQKHIDNKNVNNGGTWEPTNEKREFNEISKIFTEDGKTLIEERANEEGEFLGRWIAQNEGKDVDKYKPVTGSATASGAPAPAVNAGTPLFT